MVRLLASGRVRKAILVAVLILGVLAPAAPASAATDWRVSLDSLWIALASIFGDPPPQVVGCQIDPNGKGAPPPLDGGCQIDPDGICRP